MYVTSIKPTYCFRYFAFRCYELGSLPKKRAKPGEFLVFSRG